MIPDMSLSKMSVLLKKSFHKVIRILLILETLCLLETIICHTYLQKYKLSFEGHIWLQVQIFYVRFVSQTLLASADHFIGLHFAPTLVSYFHQATLTVSATNIMISQENSILSHHTTVIYISLYPQKSSTKLK